MTLKWKGLRLTRDVWVINDAVTAFSSIVIYLKFIVVLC